MWKLLDFIITMSSPSNESSRLKEFSQRYLESKKSCLSSFRKSWINKRNLDDQITKWFSWECIWVLNKQAIMVQGSVAPWIQKLLKWR